MNNLNQSQYRDLTIERAVAQMMHQTGNMTLVVDRMLTFGAAQSCMDLGTDKTVSMLSYMQAMVESGAFDYLGNPDPDNEPYHEPTDEEIRAKCSDAVMAAMDQMTDAGATMAVMVDKLLTAASVAAVRTGGSFKAAEILRTYADQLDAGAMAQIEPTGDGTAH